MSLLDELSDVTPDQRSWVRRMDELLRTERSPFLDLLFGYTSERGIDASMLFDERTPPLGVHAVGLMPVRERWSPVVLVMRELTPEWHPAEPIPADALGSFGMLLELAGGTSSGDIAVIGIDPPRAQYESVHGDLVGTLGLPVRLPDGSEGALTAGHVAREVGAAVRLGSGESGSVTFSDHRARHTGGTPCADVAALRLDAGWKQHSRVPQNLSMGSPRDLNRLTPVNRSGTGSAGQPVRCAGDRFFVDETTGAWGDFIFVDPISIEGDSGSLALTDDGCVAGQVVGGLSGAYSIVQDIEYLLAATGAQPDL